MNDEPKLLATVVVDGEVQYAAIVAAGDHIDLTITNSDSEVKKVINVYFASESGEIPK